MRHEATCRVATTETILGRVTLAASDRGICLLLFDSDPEEIRRLLPGVILLDAEGGCLEPELATVSAYLAAPQHGLALELDLAHGSAFDRRVWEALRDIPSGKTVSYGEVARRIGVPSAHRAVARACATNRIALAVPCHRVVRAGGALAGYRWGLERKRWLLAAEDSRNPRDGSFPDCTTP